MLPNSPLNRGLVSFSLGFLLVFSLLVFHLRETCFRDPSSIFFRPEHARVLSYSAFRRTQARKHAAQAGVHEPVKWSNATEGVHPELCIAIGSVSRQGFSYLKETLGSVLEGLDDVERSSVYVVVFLAHTDQTEHEDFGQPWLRNMADSLPTYPQDAAMLELVRKLEKENDYPAHARKQKIDYSVLLDECAKVHPEYTMTLEDDVIALDGWFHRMRAALQTAAQRTRDMGRSSFLYMRIFHDGRLLGWNAEEAPVYIFYSVATVIPQLVVLWYLRWRFAAVQKAVPLQLLLLVYGICMPMMIGLFFAAGRSCMLPKPPGVSLMQQYGCCGQGLVFPQDQVNRHLLPMYSNSNDSHAAVDTFLEDWADSRDELRWAVSPVLIQHVGGKSSHGAGDQRFGQLTDDMPFDYAFESNDPVELAKEHQIWSDGLRKELMKGKIIE
ncbi:integral membrane protein [Truncatella angustata]|uniref:Integral membrane protein n=1 Tax=Truncatella angustata TaxID=152316 RepID=A0A9P8ZVC6_9PEZI|nr:uncharacterized protein BKA67DRAFT_661614 [Truncatella angustata]KAH6648654.1 integral membrane protein [Truncatella angustata]KAH8198165.1 hypothetical protein TruAng_007646 [Truncatella angustata]